jgi:hypothetical protein
LPARTEDLDNWNNEKGARIMEEFRKWITEKIEQLRRQKIRDRTPGAITSHSDAYLSGKLDAYKEISDSFAASPHRWKPEERQRSACMTYVGDSTQPDICKVCWCHKTLHDSTVRS